MEKIKGVMDRFFVPLELAGSISYKGDVVHPGMKSKVMNSMYDEQFTNED